VWAGPPGFSSDDNKGLGWHAGRLLAGARPGGIQAAARGLPSSRFGASALNRWLNVVLAATCLVIGAPVIAAAAIAIRLYDGGPAIYRQERMGKDGKPFELLKLRTMSVGAEYRGTGIVVSTRDPRITGPGRFIRKTSLDELPQLWNILRGDMALVGPRPTVRSQVIQYNAHQRRRLEVLPGLTGWAQVNGRNTLSWAERIELDVWYVDNKSVLLDLRILALTPKALLMPNAIYGQDGTTPDFESTAED